MTIIIIIVAVVVVVVTKDVNGATDRMARCRATFRNHIRNTAIVGTTRRILHAFIYLFVYLYMLVCVGMINQKHAYMVRSGTWYLVRSFAMNNESATWYLLLVRTKPPHNQQK